MERVGNLQDSRTKLTQEVAALLDGLRNLLAINATDLRGQFRILRNIRSLAYENMNQILHEALLLRAIDYLLQIYTQNIEWFWNPRQTGDSNEPDLRGMANKTILISAEATTSDEPQAKVDRRMQDTLTKLSTMQGDLFYFVETESMRRRAQTKVAKAGYNIKVVLC
jgi:hypothetical protein